jgi:hypothetical protein
MTDQAHLLEEVVRHKQHFFHEPTARYDLAKKPTLRLAPGKLLEEALREDYDKMKEMYFGDAPDFDEVMNTVRELEKTVNNS